MEESRRLVFLKIAAVLAISNMTIIEQLRVVGKEAVKRAIEGYIGHGKPESLDIKKSAEYCEYERFGRFLFDVELRMGGATTTQHLHAYVSIEHGEVGIKFLGSEEYHRVDLETL